ncbi:unnamed protein product, partial [marine sediment metagenome]
MAKKTRFAVIGTGGRSRMFWQALGEDPRIKRHNELVALLEPNRTRADYVNSQLGAELPIYQPHQFERMIKREKLDAVVVTTRDNLHDLYIVKGLEAGLKVVTE